MHIGTSRFTYLALYKPRHMLVTKADPRGRATIWEKLARYRDHCNAVGRLDFESEGLLLITDDGALLHRLTHPRYAVRKRYHVKVQGLPTTAILAKLAKGMTVAGVTYQPIPVQRLRHTEHNAWLEFTLHEGKYREIRTLCETVGHPVLKLKRIAVGPIQLGALRPGSVRKLRPREIAALRQLVHTATAPGPESV